MHTKRAQSQTERRILTTVLKAGNLRRPSKEASKGGCFSGRIGIWRGRHAGEGFKHMTRCGVSSLAEPLVRYWYVISKHYSIQILLWIQHVETLLEALMLALRT